MTFRKGGWGFGVLGLLGNKGEIKNEKLLKK